jgi:hypothetical protein
VAQTPANTFGQLLPFGQKYSLTSGLELMLNQLVQNFSWLPVLANSGHE